jgi:flagellar hook-associated protein 3 FlgL
MRIATSMIFDAGVANINKQWSSLLHLQQQVASGRRILTPSDDPVAAARALEVTQSSDILTQYATNQQNATSALGLAEAQLTSVNDMFARLKELTVQAGNATLSASDRKSIAFELRSHFDELLGIANAADGQGQHLFSGYMGDTKPFAGTVESGVTYSGDDGQRKLQVSATRMLEISDSGKDVFMRIRNGNGHFVTDYAAGNTGTGIIDGGSVVGNFVSDTYTISFAPSAGGLDYTVTGAVSGVVTTGAYRSGDAITFNGASVTITGTPAATDTFTVAPSTSQSVFTTLGNLIVALESNTSQPAAAAKYTNEIGFALRDLDQANDNILRVRSMIGSRMNELESLDSMNQDLQLQYQQTLSNLQDLDYAKAISDLTRKQTDLQAAQQSFAKISQLSLFDYI